MSSTDAPPPSAASSVAPGTSAAPGASAAAPATPKPKSGLRAALEYTGIPPSLFEKKPRLPSRNWLIFLTVTSSLTGLYFYDRRECRRAREEYVNKVKHLSEVPLHSMDMPRKVTVYGAKWPGDEDYDRNMKYFRKYVKPVLVAAAVDFEMIKGKRHGDIAERIADDVKTRRRRAAGLEAAPQSAVPLPVKFSDEERRRELAGGIVLVGRGTFKEFMAGLTRGWTEPLDRVDKEAALAEELAHDGAFDEPPEPEADGPAGALDGEPLPTPSRFNPAGYNPAAPSNTPVPIFSPLQAQMRAMEPKAPPAPEPKPAAPAVPAHLNAPPAHVPVVPPLLLVAHTNFIGLSQIPRMLWDFFNERHHARAGAAAGYALVMGQSRPFVAPAPSVHLADPAAATGSDLDFGRDTEAFYKSSLSKWPKEVEKARTEYYAELPKRLETARALARRTREATSDEVKYPPPTEVELRQERMQKEQRWRADMRGWDVVRPDAAVAWDERLDGALSVFVPPAEEARPEGESAA